MPQQTLFVIGELKRFVGREGARAAARACRVLIFETPRDTGWAASNWILSIGAPYSGLAGSKQRLDLGPQQAGLAAASAPNIRGDVFLTNNVPYIGELNRGHSAQQPVPGFVERALERAVRR